MKAKLCWNDGCVCPLMATECGRVAWALDVGIYADEKDWLHRWRCFVVYSWVFVVKLNGRLAVFVDLIAWCIHHSYLIPHSPPVSPSQVARP
jgi:hypothetical protein